ncbi:hypothetical protein D3C78_970880 [compost metagenome]
MPQQHLHHPQIGAVVEQMGGEGVAQGVGGELSPDPRPLGIELDAMPEGLAGHHPGLLGGEDHVRAGAPQQQGAGLPVVTLQPVDRLLPHGHQSLLVALAHHPHQPLAQADMLGGEPHQLGDPQPGGIEQLEHRLVPQLQRIVHQGRREQRIHLGLAEIRGQLLGQLGALQQHCRIVAAQFFPIQILIEAAQGREEAGRAARRKLLVHPPGEVVLDVVHPRQQQGATLAVEPEGKLFQIRAIGADRIVGQPPLQPEGIEEGLDQGMVVHGRGRLGHGVSVLGKRWPIVACQAGAYTRGRHTRR